MRILRTVSELEEFATQACNEGKSIGLVPTMGALHAGHMSLMRRAVEENDITIASVFVNPVQFDNKTDLATYPRTEEADCKLLEEAGVCAAFIPSVEEIYPPQDADKPQHVFDLGEVAEVMEGPRRPGHFQGVALIVSKLMRWSRAGKAYFGEKDFQQIAVIRRMILTENIPVEIVPCPIKREDDGLALSSRNVRLNASQRAIAPGIYKALKESVSFSCEHTPGETSTKVIKEINLLSECEVEYFDIVDAITMQPVSDWSEAGDHGVQGCITVYCGPVRLIDNIRYR